ncbi:MAG: glycosyltransferase, partial [Myxococcota bacterium]|nr:glycosyltransferase [Myxococcota bacterium]
RVYRRLVNNFTIPDENVLDIPGILFAAQSQPPPDVIIASGPPNSIFLAGALLSKRLGSRYILDFRDPWTEHPRHAPPTPIHTKLHSLFETQLLKSADGISAATEYMAQRLSLLAGSTIPVHPFYNGYNPSQTEPAALPSREKPLVGFYGSFYGLIDPKPLVKAVVEANAKLEHAGFDLDGELATAVQEYGADFESLGMLTPQEARQRMSQANVVAMVLPDDPSWAYCRTQKLAEYLGCGRPILSLGPPGEASELIHAENAGQSFQHHQIREAASAIHALADRPTTPNRSPDLQWETQTKEMAKFVERIANPS